MSAAEVVRLPGVDPGALNSQALYNADLTAMPVDDLVTELGRLTERELMIVVVHRMINLERRQAAFEETTAQHFNQIEARVSPAAKFTIEGRAVLGFIVGAAGVAGIVFAGLDVLLRLLAPTR